MDHHLPKRIRQGLGLLREREFDTNIVEAIRSDIHQRLSIEGPVIYRLQDGIVRIDDYIEQILDNRIKVFNSDRAKAIMAKQGRFTSQDYEKCTRRASAWTKRYMHLAAIQQGVPGDSVKSLLYPRQLVADSMGDIEKAYEFIFSPQTRSLSSDLQKQKEIQTLLTLTIDSVSHNLSILAGFRDSQPHLKGTTQDMFHQTHIKKLVNECNELSSLANRMYQFTGSSLAVPRFGKITLEETIIKADEAKYADQWSTYGAKTPGNIRLPKDDLRLKDDLRSKDDLRKFNELVRNELVFTTNGLVDNSELVGIETNVFRYIKVVTVTEFTKPFRFGVS